MPLWCTRAASGLRALRTDDAQLIGTCCTCYCFWLCLLEHDSSQPTVQVLLSACAGARAPGRRQRAQGAHKPQFLFHYP